MENSVGASYYDTLEECKECKEVFYLKTMSSEPRPKLPKKDQDAHWARILEKLGVK